MKRSHIVGIAFLSALAGCALHGRTSPSTEAAGATDGDSAGPPPVVQVRDYPNSASVTVVAWDVDDNAFGLRASINRAGEIVGERKIGDHRLYVTPTLVRYMGDFRYATITTGRPLLRAPARRDFYSCFYGKDCSPITTVGVYLPDSVLRANRDSLTVTFYPRIREAWEISLRHELIVAYLGAVDSVVASMKRVATK